MDAGVYFGKTTDEQFVKLKEPTPQTLRPQTGGTPLNRDLDR